MSLSYPLASMYGSRRKLDRLRETFKADSWYCGDSRTSFTRRQHFGDFLSLGKGNFRNLVWNSGKNTFNHIENEVWRKFSPLYAQVGKSLTERAEMNSLPFHCSSKECLFWNSQSEIYRFIKLTCPFISCQFVGYVTKKKLKIIWISAFTANIPYDIPVLLLEDFFKARFYWSKT